MSTPAIEARIEQLTEAMEDMAVAVAATLPPGTNAADHRTVLEARQNMKDALREFLKPALRLAETCAHPPIMCGDDKRR